MRTRVQYATDPKLADVAVKDEGYADVRFRTPAAKLMAFELGIPNQLQEFGAEFCGTKVYYHDKPETHDGVYHCGMKTGYLETVAKEMNRRGLTAHPDTDFLQGKRNLAKRTEA